MIGIRVDGNEKIGTGHLMRCLSIADALREAGSPPVFFTVDGMDIIEKEGFEFRAVKGVFDDLRGEDIQPQLAQSGITTLLVDSYFADRAYFEKLAGKVKTAAIFDYGDTGIPVDLLINYNFNYGSYSYPADKKLLLGCAYAPLREEFQHIRFKRNFESAQNILITTGGTDRYNITTQIVRRIRQNTLFAGIVLHVVIGGLNAFPDEIKRLGRELPDIQCYENCNQMAQLMQKCDIALSAGGSTLYELCACGIPCVTFSMADNQVDIVDVMGQKGVMVSAGHYEQDAGACLDSVLDGLARLVRDKTLRESYSKKESKLVDGKGAARLAREIIKLNE